MTFRRRSVRQPASDGGEALELPAARLTLTFGFGTGLFACPRGVVKGSYIGRKLFE